MNRRQPDNAHEHQWPSSRYSFPNSLHCLTLLLLGLLEHLLDDLLLLDEEGTDDPVLDAVCASRATISTLDGLLGAADLCVFAGTESGDTGELDTAVTTLGSGALLLDVEISELASGSLDYADILARGVVGRSSAVCKSGGRHLVGIPGASDGRFLNLGGPVGGDRFSR